MKRIFVFLVMSLFLFAGCTDHSKHEKGAEVSKKEEVTYSCPMHPHVRSDKPGSCSICGMDLVLLETEESSDDHSGHDHAKKQEGIEKTLQGRIPEGRAPVKMSLDKQQLIGITSEVVKKVGLFKKVKAPGRIAFDPELYNAQSEYIEALRQWGQVQNSPLEEVKRSTREMIKSAQIRLRVMGLNAEQIKKLAKRKSVSEGLIVGAGEGENLIYADVFERDLSHIKKGQDVEIRGSFLGGKILKGSVIAVDQVIDPKTRSGKVRIKIEKTKASIRPEAFVNVSIAVPLGKHLAISLESVLDTGRELFVFVKKTKGEFEPRRITRLLETDDFMAVLGGLEEGEEVVTSANFMLDSESRLKAVIKGASSGHNH